MIQTINIVLSLFWNLLSKIYLQKELVLNEIIQINSKCDISINIWDLVDYNFVFVTIRR